MKDVKSTLHRGGEGQLMRGEQNFPTVMAKVVDQDSTNHSDSDLFDTMSTEHIDYC